MLTLSKPSHFVHGEPQDSAEYLNHLLDCLHEEEMQIKVKQINMNNEPIEYPIVATSAKETQDSVSLADANAVPDNSARPRSLIRRLFGGTMSRCTACVRCQHVSSAELEDFICLFLPLDGPNSTSTKSASESEVGFLNAMRMIVEC